MRGESPTPLLSSPEALVDPALEQALHAVPAARAFSHRLLAACAIRLRDIIDHIALPHDPEFAARGWRHEGASIWRRPSIALPDLIESGRFGVAFRVECVERFLAAAGVDTRIEGAAHGPYRAARVFDGGGVTFTAVERRGWSGFSPPDLGSRKIRRARIHQQIFRTRRRQFQNASRGLAHMTRLAEAAAADLGAGWAGALFLRAEREYWLTRSASALRQHQRQAAFGVGWCTVSRHAYACSREHFDETLHILKLLGHTPLDVARVDAVANWGVQTLDASSTAAAPHTLVSVDLATHETAAALAGKPSPLTWHGPPGLWCALHGESMLDAGLHCVSAAYDVTLLRTQLAHDAAAAPKQQARARSSPARHVFQEEPRPVDPRRVEILERAGYITHAQAEFYRLSGAAGAHFETALRQDERSFPELPEFAVDALPRDDQVEGAAPRRRRLRVKRARLQRELM